jgi:exosortase
MNSLATRVAPALLTASGFGLLYWPVIVKLVADWKVDDNYSHGFVIVPLAAYLAWERRGQLRSRPVAPSAVGLAVVVFSALLLIGGDLASDLFLTRVSMLCALAGAGLFLWGAPRMRVLAFPWAVLFLMVPLPALLFNEIAFPLQLLASRTGELALRALNIPVLRDGNVLVLATMTLDVAEACSGIRSLVSLATMGLVIGYVADPRPWVRVFLIVAAAPVAIAANAVRVAGTGIAASRYGPETAEGFIHAFSGWLVFVVSVVLILGLQRVVSRLTPLPPASARPAMP